jgi:hypothetical protein
MAKSAATILSLGADHLVFGPGGDLGPVDPQMRYPNGTLASAKELVEAVDEAERRITANPDTYPLFANLLAEVTMIMVEQARFALARSGALVREALAAATGRTQDDVEALAATLQEPLIEEPTSHSAVISCDAARKFGLPAEAADPTSETCRSSGRSGPATSISARSRSGRLRSTREIRRRRSSALELTADGESGDDGSTYSSSCASLDSTRARRTST